MGVRRLSLPVPGRQSSCSCVAMVCSLAPSRRSARRSGGPAVHREADYPPAKFRGAGDRDSERAAPYRRRARRWSSRPRPPRCPASSTPRPTISGRHTLCEATQGALVTFDGEWFRAGATRGMPDSFAEHMRRCFPPVDGSPTDQLAHGECIHTHDLAAYAAKSPPEVARLNPRSILPARAPPNGSFAQGRSRMEFNTIRAQLLARY